MTGDILIGGEDYRRGATDRDLDRTTRRLLVAHMRKHRIPEARIATLLPFHRPRLHLWLVGISTFPERDCREVLKYLEKVNA